MATNFEISETKLADAGAIASLFILSWNSPFTQLQFGQVDPAQLAASMVPRIAEQITTRSSRFIVARHKKTHEVVAVAQWTVPSKEEKEEGQGMMTGGYIGDTCERQQFEDEVLRRSLPASSNKDLVMAFTMGLRQLREETLQGRKHILLENLATHPKYRGMGLASRLVEWGLSLADEQQLLVYLDTASDNPAVRLYKRLGFEEQGRNTIEDLSKYASISDLRKVSCDTEHTHVAFLRFPQNFRAERLKY